MSHYLSIIVFMLVIVIGALAIVLAVNNLGIRYAKLKGYSYLGENTVVMCSKGHLFTTVWIPGGSIKSVRLGMKRYQRCPICKHWRIVAPVKDAELTDVVKRKASEHHDNRIP